MHTCESLIAFESRVRAAWEAGELPTLLHLCGGNEDPLLKLFASIQPADWVFSTHRSHYHALLKGIPEDHVFAEIMAGRSMFLFSAEHNFFTSAILASTCCIAAGVAWSLKNPGLPLRPGESRLWSPPPTPEPTPELRARQELNATHRPHVWCFLGDGAEEQGHFYEAALFAEAHELPITFIIEDNDRQVDTAKRVRRGDPLNAAQHPLDHFACVRRYYYTPTYPHAGSGCKHQITFKPEAIDRLGNPQSAIRNPQ